MDITNPLILAIWFSVLSLILCVVSIIVLGRHTKVSQVLIESLDRAEQARDALMEKLERDEQSRQTLMLQYTNLMEMDTRFSQIKNEEEINGVSKKH